MKTKYPSAVSLTKQQIDWMRKQPNGSEIIGKIIDAFIAVEHMTPHAFHSVQTHLAAELLQQKLYDAITQRRELLRKNESHFKCFETTSGRFTDRWVENPEDPTPIDESGQIIKRVLADYDESIKQMQSEIQKLKNELLQPKAEPAEKN